MFLNNSCTTLKHKAQCTVFPSEWARPLLKGLVWPQKQKEEMDLVSGMRTSLWVMLLPVTGPAWGRPESSPSFFESIYRPCLTKGCLLLEEPDQKTDCGARNGRKWKKIDPLFITELSLAADKSYQLQSVFMAHSAPSLWTTLLKAFFMVSSVCRL